MIGLAYTNARGEIFFDESVEPLADGGTLRAPHAAELIAAPRGTVTTMLPGRAPAVGRGRRHSGRTALAALLPAGYTRLLLPAYVSQPGAPTLPLFGYTFACVRDDALYVAAAKTDESDDWSARYFVAGELEGAVERRLALDPANAVLLQLEQCAKSYGCFTAQNVFLVRGEAAIPVSPRCNAACVGCISELDFDAGIPAPQTRITYEAEPADIAAVATHHLAHVEDGIVSFGQGCEGEPLLRATTIARAIERIREAVPNGTLNINTNGSLPLSLQMLIDAGLQACRISLNSFRPGTYAAYYRPVGYGLEDVLESVRLAVRAGIRVSLNVLTHPGVTDERDEIAHMDAFLAQTPVSMIQTRTLNIDPEVYFRAVGRPREPQGMLRALDCIAKRAIRIGNFTHAT